MERPEWRPTKRPPATLARNLSGGAKAPSIRRGPERGLFFRLRRDRGPRPAGSISTFPRDPGPYDPEKPTRCALGRWATMKNAARLCLGVGLTLSMASGLLAQAPAPPGPPRALLIFRAEVKPGKGPAHQKWETGWPRALAKVSWPA